MILYDVLSRYSSHLRSHICVVSPNFVIHTYVYNYTLSITELYDMLICHIAQRYLVTAALLSGMVAADCLICQLFSCHWVDWLVGLLSCSLAWLPVGNVYVL